MITWKPKVFLSLCSCVLFASMACGFPRPDHVGDDDAGIDGPIDAELPPGTSIRVSGTGDDANDGITAPVKTLKHAIGLAVANSEITSIVLATGRYSAAGGESFPYTIPRNVLLIGPAGGGAILTGSKVEQGVTVGDGTLKDLELEDFTVAVIAVGNAALTNIHVRTAKTAMQVRPAGKASLTNVDIAGAIGACASGVELTGTAHLTANMLTTRSLGSLALAKDSATIDLTGISVTGDPSCSQTVINGESGGALNIKDSVFDGGQNGLVLAPRSGTLTAIITGTSFRNFKNNALSGGPGFGGTVDARVVGGELSVNGRAGAEIGGALWSFTNVSIKENGVMGVYFQDGMLTMRGCDISNNHGTGVNLLTPIKADLGTTASPGSNTLHNNAATSVNLDGGAVTIDAVGNTWNPGVQGADNAGRYPTSVVVPGPVAFVSFNNFSLTCDPGQCGIRR